jgi:secretion/DNA translocation related TadE-like protein
MSDDQGSASVLALAVLVLVCFGAVIGFAKAQAVIVSRQAAGAADLAALAAAQAEGQPCARAESVAGANGTTLVECRTDGGDAFVRVEMPAPWLVARLLDSFGFPAPVIGASARAGQPASS